MESLKIILLCIVAAVAFGIVHDQVTARVCVEYFTIGHPPIFHTDDPTLLAFGWGVIATWWMGLILGVPAVLASRVGSWPKFDAAAHLVRPIGVLADRHGLLIAGGEESQGTSWPRPWDRAARMVSWLHESRLKEAKCSFLADGTAHLAAYGVAPGSLEALDRLCIWVVFSGVGDLAKRATSLSRRRDASVGVTRRLTTIV